MFLWVKNLRSECVFGGSLKGQHQGTSFGASPSILDSSFADMPPLGGFLGYKKWLQSFAHEDIIR